MPSLTFVNINDKKLSIPEELLKGKRHLTPAEISVLEDNLNTNTDGTWENFYVDDSDMGFDPTLIKSSQFSGFIILGRLWPAKLKFHDLELNASIFGSRLRNTVTGNDNAIVNTAYLDNYRLGDRVILFNVQEMSCTTHSKFGNGIIKKGEEEKVRIQIAVGNENEGRSILPFETLIPADAYIWEKYRGDKALLEKLKAFTQTDFYGDDKTYGTVGDDAVIKNTTLIKDAKIGSACYIKGAFKLKNVTILSNPDEESQIGEGVEMVNGIMAEGSRVFYQAVAVRFVIGRNCQLKYGARLLNSVLGDNSTVSCCELLNNLIYPFHEQHHNSSFLIATTIQGQSNIAAGATIGSNHNSRSPDGEIFAGRGFWPGLCSDFKHSSRFSSFVLASKGSYQHELNILYPFCLLLPSEKPEGEVQIIPAWYFMYDMFAMARNGYKFKARDKRKTIIQHIETEPLAPDTVQDMINAVDRLITLTAERLEELDNDAFKKAKDHKEKILAAKDFLHKKYETDFTLHDPICQKKYGAIIYKPGKAYKTYRKMIKYFAVKSLLEYVSSTDCGTLDGGAAAKITPDFIKNSLKKIPLYTKWLNAGGQVLPEEKITELRNLIKDGKIKNWDEVHAFYTECQKSYAAYKARYAVFIIERMYMTDFENFSRDQIQNMKDDAFSIADELYKATFTSREKDYTDYFRKMMYESEEEMNAVIGTLEDNSFLTTFKKDTEDFKEQLENIFKDEQ